MRYKTLIREAWDITRNNPHLKWLSFVAGFYFLFMWIIRARYLLPDQYIGTHQIVELASNHVVWTIIIAILFYLTYSVIPVILNASIITLISGIKRNKPYKIGQAISLGLIRFLPLYEFKAFFTPLRVVTSASVPFIAWRYLALNEFWQIMLLFVLFMFIMTVLRFLFAYSEYFIVLCETKFLRSIKNSLFFILFFWNRTLILGILLFIISIMVVLNAFMWIAVPLGLSYLLGFVLSYLSPLIAYTIWGVLALFLFYIFLNTYAFFTVFTKAVWSLAFMELLEEYQNTHLKKIRNIPSPLREDEDDEEDEKSESWKIKKNYHND